MNIFYVHRFLYCGKINLSVESGSDILTLLKTANEFELHSFVKHIQEFLVNNQFISIKLTNRLNLGYKYLFLI